jgi:hypothetical protein
LSGSAISSTTGAPRMTATINSSTNTNNNCNAGLCHDGSKTDGTAGTRIF